MASNSRCPPPMVPATRSANTAIQAPRSRGTEPRDSITSTQHSGPCARPCSTFLNVSLHMGAPDSPSWRLRASLEFVAGFSAAALEFCAPTAGAAAFQDTDRKSTRLNSSHLVISYAVFCLKKKKKELCVARIPNTKILNAGRRRVTTASLRPTFRNTAHTDRDKLHADLTSSRFRRRLSES